MFQSQETLAFTRSWKETMNTKETHLFDTFLPLVLVKKKVELILKSTIQEFFQLIPNLPCKVGYKDENILFYISQ